MQKTAFLATLALISVVFAQYPVPVLNLDPTYLSGLWYTAIDFSQGYNTNSSYPYPCSTQNFTLNGLEELTVIYSFNRNGNIFTAVDIFDF